MNCLLANGRVNLPRKEEMKSENADRVSGQVERFVKPRPYYEDELITIYNDSCLDILPQIEGKKFIITSPPYGVGKSYESKSDELDFEYLIRKFLSVAADSMNGGDYLCLNLPDRYVLDKVTGMRPAMPIIWKDIISTGLLYYDKRIWKKDPAWMRDQWHSSTVKSVSEIEELYIFRKKGVSNFEKKIISIIINAKEKKGFTNKDIDKWFGFNGMANHWTSLNGQAEIPTFENWIKLRKLLSITDKYDSDVKKHNKNIRERLSRGEWVEWGSRQVWDIKSVQKNNIHPAMFPRELPYRAIRIYSDDDTIIIDPFMGSGTTLKVSRILGRKAIGIEKEEKYCEMVANSLRQSELF